jgi:hypothetical protein
LDRPITSMENSSSDSAQQRKERALAGVRSIKR